jgi:hypothetical protein
MKVTNKIYRVDLQGYDEPIDPIDFLKEKDVKIIKYAYSFFGACYFIELESDVVIDNKSFIKIDTPPKKMNWNK